MASFEREHFCAYVCICLYTNMYVLTERQSSFVFTAQEARP